MRQTFGARLFYMKQGALSVRIIHSGNSKVVDVSTWKIIEVDVWQHINDKFIFVKMQIMLVSTKEHLVMQLMFLYYGYMFAISRLLLLYDWFMFGS